MLIVNCNFLTYQAYTDDLEEDAAATTALPEEITLTEVAPEPTHGE